jgi:hypothetical protein
MYGSQTRYIVMQKLLILSSNPRGDLNLEREIDDLQSALERLEKFETRRRGAVRCDELPELLADYSPQFVHFCGHGAGEKGLVFQDEDGREQLISTEILTRIFKTFAQEIHCTVLNACDSDRQAEAIAKQIQYVVGMSQPILDKAAYLFSVAFYKGLAAQKSIEQAYEMGCIAIQTWCERQSQPVQSRQYRKLATVGEDMQSASLSLPEYQKPVLLKEGIRWTPYVGKDVLPNRSEEFVDFVHQAIDRKDYKDKARAAYDNFGQFSSENVVSLSKSELKQRQIFLSKVKQFWIEGFLQPSLQGVGALSLELKARPDAIADLSQGIEALSIELDASYERLQETRIYEEMGQGRTLLILGSPGAGKTIALLQLTQRLIERSENNPSIPMPVVLNLSSWANEKKLIADWLMDELREKYQVPELLSQPWIEQEQLILLLDGLDEVKKQHRNACVRALNEFIISNYRTEMAVCSRVQDYEALTERLQISSALCLQPLSSEQVYQFLDSDCDSLAGLKALLKGDAELEQFAQTPLILNFMSVAYRGWPVNKLIHEFRSAPDREQHLFNTYIDRRLKKGTSSYYSKDQALHWLSWLASGMLQEKRTIFLVEKLQPTWLQDSEEKTYKIRLFIVSGLIFGLIGILIGGLFFERIYSITIELNSGKIEHLFFLLGGGLFGGLSGGLIGGIITGLPKEISPLGKLDWSWERASYRFMGEMFVGIVNGLIFGLILGLISGQIIKQMNISIFGRVNILIGGLIFGLAFGLIFGLIGGLLLGLMSGLGSSEIDRRTISNQGIHSSWRNCLIVGIGLWLMVGLIDSLVFELIFKLIYKRVNGLNFGITDSLIFGVLGGLIGGLIGGLKYGGAACIQHFTLRKILCQKGRVPWNYTKFLDFTSKRLLMKKVGGGYVFFHRMLLEHFAKKAEVV